MLLHCLEEMGLIRACQGRGKEARGSVELVEGGGEVA